MSVSCPIQISSRQPVSHHRGRNIPEPECSESPLAVRAYFRVARPAATWRPGRPSVTTTVPVRGSRRSKSGQLALVATVGLVRSISAGPVIPNGMTPSSARNHVSKWGSAVRGWAGTKVWSPKICWREPDVLQDRQLAVWPGESSISCSKATIDGIDQLPPAPERSYLKRAVSIVPCMYRSGERSTRGCLPKGRALVGAGGNNGPWQRVVNVVTHGLCEAV